MHPQCYVCQELFGDSDVVMAPQCGHTFHKYCIRQWLGIQRSCPTCCQTMSIKQLGRIFFDIDFSVEVDSADLQQKLDEMSRELNTQVQLKQKADEKLRKCRRLLSTFRLELQQTKKELKEKEEQSSLAEEIIQIYTAEKAKLKEKFKALTESISPPSGDLRNSALSQFKKMKFDPVPSTSCWVISKTDLEVTQNPKSTQKVPVPPVHTWDFHALKRREDQLQ